MLWEETELKDEIFTFIGPSGVLEVFNVTRLIDFVVKNPNCAEYIEDDIDPQWIEYVRKERGIEDRALQLITPDRLELPTLCVMREDDTTLMVDGHHRLVRRHQEGLKTYLIIRVKLGQWEWSRITNPPEFFKMVV